jgi:carboxymethylenebutenolidase
MSRHETGTTGVGAGREMRYTVALPDGDPPAGGWPGVIVLFEALGMTPEMLVVADRFAERGWAAYIPDYLSAGTRIGCLMRGGREVMAGRRGPLTASLAAAARHFAARRDVDGDRLAVLGFCLGGGLALLLGSVRELGLRAVATNYGRTPAVETLRGSPPVVASFGGRDRSTAAEPRRLSERLTTCGVPIDVKTYPDAGHSFLTDGHHPVASALMVPMRLGYVPDAAQDAWGRIDAWLDQYVRQ